MPAKKVTMYIVIVNYYGVCFNSTCSKLLVVFMFIFRLCFLQGLSGGNLLSIPNVAIHCASVCDVDIRPVSY